MSLASFVVQVEVVHAGREMQGVLISGLLSFWGGLLVGVLVTLFAVSPNLRSAASRAVRAFWNVPEAPNRQQNWRGGVQLARYHLD